ncbi:MAG: hypothetical protein N3I86_03430 [Verrucomicrobiae bacterium]|nr:hypothetical protein [Verrucomicrobiae bacterium]
MNKTGQVAVDARADRIAQATGFSDFCLTLKPQPGERVEVLLARVARELEARQAEPLHVLAFGAVQQASAAAAALVELLGERECPMTWVEGASCDGSAMAGMQVFAVTGAEVERVRVGNRVAACVFHDETGRHCVIGGLSPSLGVDSPVSAARRVFELLEWTLARTGFGLGDVGRTWFFLDDLLAWYEAFNRVRAEFYERARFRAGCLPASTGVAARNPAGAPLTAAAWAMQPLHGATRVVEVPSPLQGPARAYGSWFSRAVEVLDGRGAGGAGRRLWISGTASIAPDGRTLYSGLARPQIEHTLRVVEAILESRGYGWGEVTRAVAYFKRASDAALFRAWQERRELRRLPVVETVCGICRGDLEFEIELDARR